MKSLLLAGATVVLLAAVSLAPTMAQAPKLVGGSTRPGISQRIDPGASSAAAVTPRYELQYGYDKHARWRGHWILIR
jgi:hypothetical protein